MILEHDQASQGTHQYPGHATASRFVIGLGTCPKKRDSTKKMKTLGCHCIFCDSKRSGSEDGKARACELLEPMGSKTLPTNRTDALSKGMQQKVQMLASIAHDPEFVVLDEPFSASIRSTSQVMEESFATWLNANAPSFFYSRDAARRAPVRPDSADREREKGFLTHPFEAKGIFPRGSDRNRG